MNTFYEHIIAKVWFNSHDLHDHSVSWKKSKNKNVGKVHYLGLKPTECYSIKWYVSKYY